MEKQLKTQLDNAEEIKKVLKIAEGTCKLQNNKDINTVLVYLPCYEDGKVNLDKFFGCIKAGILQNFVFSCSEIKKKLDVESDASEELLFEKGIRKLSQHTAQGELGELILFTLLDVYFLAPKLLSKISMKTSPRMPVFGADAVHGQVYDGEFRVYLGESKLHKSFKSATSKAIPSIKSAKDKFDIEFDLLDSHIDFPDIEPKIEKMILDVSLTPFNGHRKLSYNTQKRNSDVQPKIHKAI